MDDKANLMPWEAEDAYVASYDAQTRRQIADYQKRLATCTEASIEDAKWSQWENS